MSKDLDTIKLKLALEELGADRDQMIAIFKILGIVERPPRDYGRLPKAGEIIHYTNRVGCEPLPAILTEIYEPNNARSACSLVLLNPLLTKVDYGFNCGQWHWPDCKPAIVTSEPA